MVKIKEFMENDSGTSEDETTDDEEVPPVPHDTPSGQLVFLAPEPSAPYGADDGTSAESPSSNAISPISTVGLSRRQIWFMLRQYNQSIEFNASIQEGRGSILVNGLSRWAIELQQLASPGGCGNDGPQSARRDFAADTPDMEDSSPERAASGLDAESSLQTIDENSDREDDNKTESDESAKEKSNGVAEKLLLANTAAGAKAALLASPELSDCELSDVSDCLAPPDYESLQAVLTEDYTPSALKDCSWAKDVRQTFGIDDVDPEPTVAAKKETSEASDDGEAAALPASFVVKDCWEEWVDDARLFSLAAEAPASSISTVVPARVPSPASPVSPASPTTESRRIKQKNRQRVRQLAIKMHTRLIFVPTDKIGRIVGKGGRRVRELEKESGAKIKVERKKSAKPVTQITLTGTEEETLKADQQICNIIRNYKPPKAGEPASADENMCVCMELTKRNSVEQDETTIVVFEGEE